MKQLIILTIRAMPYPGTDLEDIKREAAAYSFAMKCTLTFNHNGQEYVSDDEGNVAKSNNIAGANLGYPG